MDAYEIPLKLDQLLHEIDNAGGEVTDAQLREMQLLMDSFDDLIDGLLRRMANIDARNQMLVAEAKRLNELRAVNELRAERTEALILRLLNEVDGRDNPQWRGKVFRAKAAKCPASAAVDNEDAVPDSYAKFKLADTLDADTAAMVKMMLKTKTYTPEISRSLDKRAILDALKNGTTVPGTRLVTDKQRLMQG